MFVRRLVIALMIALGLAALSPTAASAAEFRGQEVCLDPFVCTDLPVAATGKPSAIVTYASYRGRSGQMAKTNFSLTGIDINDPVMSGVVEFGKLKPFAKKGKTLKQRQALTRKWVLAQARYSKKACNRGLSKKAVVLRSNLRVLELSCKGFVQAKYDSYGYRAVARVFTYGYYVYVVHSTTTLHNSSNVPALSTANRMPLDNITFYM